MTEEQDEEEFDVVIDALQERRDKLWKMNQGNSYYGWGLMDYIRFNQIDELDTAIKKLKREKKQIDGNIQEENQPPPLREEFVVEHKGEQLNEGKE